MESVVTVSEVSKRFTLRQGRSASVGEALYHFVRPRPKDLEPSSNHIWALQGVSLSVAAGQGLALVGHNGSGKSTMLKLIAGILQPTSGSVAVYGRVSPLIELAAGFHPDFSGRENVYLNGLILGLSKAYISGRFKDIVEFSGIAPFIDVPVKYYSSGMYMRLAFSVATQIQPDLLLIDEVLAVGDEEFQGRCIERILEMKKNGTALIFVSHSRNLVASVCDRVIWLEHGKERFRGTADEFVAAPARVGEEPPKKVHCEVWGADGERLGFGANSGDEVYVRIRVDEGGAGPWTLGCEMTRLGSPQPASMLGPVEGGTPLDDRAAEVWLHVNGLSSDAAYAVRGWARNPHGIIWAAPCEFGCEPGTAETVRWRRVSAPFRRV